MMKKPFTILLADPDKVIGQQLSKALPVTNFHLLQASSGKQALQLFERHLPAMVILELSLPEVEGIEVCRRIQQMPHEHRVHIMFLTRHTEEYAEIAAFENGADAFIRKPVKTQAFLHRLQAIYRRMYQAEESDTFLQVDAYLAINPANYQIRTGKEWHQMPKKEFDLLSLLAHHPETVFPRATLLQQIWGSDVIVSPRTVDVHISRIREKIGAQYIETIIGIGYRFKYNR